MQIEAHAKINFGLDVTGKRPDGYHTLDMIMLPISLHDTVTLLPDNAISVTISGSPANIPCDETNLAYKAAVALRDAAGVTSGVAISIEKRIPTGAGLGGGSSDAAAVLIGLNKMWNCGLSSEKLSEIGLKLGADVPFFIFGGSARVQGIGEIIKPVPVGRLLHLCIVKPEESLPTKDVFSEYDRQANHTLHPDMDLVELDISLPVSFSSGNYIGNSLQSASCRLCPEISRAVNLLLQSEKSLAAMMTGSGSAVFGLYNDDFSAQSVCKEISSDFNFCTCCTTTLHSIVIKEE